MRAYSAHRHQQVWSYRSALRLTMVRAMANAAMVRANAFMLRWRSITLEHAIITGVCWLRARLDASRPRAGRLGGCAAGARNRAAPVEERPWYFVPSHPLYLSTADTYRISISHRHGWSVCGLLSQATVLTTYTSNSTVDSGALPNPIPPHEGSRLHPVPR